MLPGSSRDGVSCTAKVCTPRFGCTKLHVSRYQRKPSLISRLYYVALKGCLFLHTGNKRPYFQLEKIAGLENLGSEMRLCNPKMGAIMTANILCAFKSHYIMQAGHQGGHQGG